MGAALVLIRTSRGPRFRGNNRADVPAAQQTRAGRTGQYTNDPADERTPRKYFALTEAGHTARASVNEQRQVVATAVHVTTEKEHTPNA